METLTILHTTDLHGRLSAAAAQRLAELKAQQGALLLDSGDALPVPNALAVPWRCAVSARMAEAGYDAVGVGNREYHFRSLGLHWAARRLPCPLVATNLRVPGAPGVRLTVVLDSPAGPVAVLAAARCMIPPRSGLARLSDIGWTDPFEVLPEALARAREQARWVVVLSHLGVRDDLTLAARGLGGDVLLGGHDHFLTPRALLGLGTPLVYSGYWARWVTVVGLSREGKRITPRVEVVRLP